jgi:DNA (cytosine-5)-methyltransferase 1
MSGRGGRKRVLDIGCGAGISSDGYAAYFDVTGIDNDPKVGKFYPYEFRCGDALALTADDLREFDAVHVGGPCQPFSKMSSCRPGLRDTYTDLIGPLRPVLIKSGVPYVIENVEGAPLKDPVWLCGLMFGKLLYRHRGFETGNGLVIPSLDHPEHKLPASRAGHWTPGTVMSIAGHIAPIGMARELMGVTRYMPREMLKEAAPAYMTAYVAAHAAAYLSREAALWTRWLTARWSCRRCWRAAARSGRWTTRCPGSRSRSSTSPTRFSSPCSRSCPGTPGRTAASWAARR